MDPSRTLPIRESTYAPSYLSKYKLGFCDLQARTVTKTSKENHVPKKKSLLFVSGGLEKKSTFLRQ